jgi:hypothetical protein
MKQVPVMLSAAKHLLFLVEKKQQIPRFARDDNVGAFFISLPSLD